MAVGSWLRRFFRGEFRGEFWAIASAVGLGRPRWPSNGVVPGWFGRRYPTVGVMGAMGAMGVMGLMGLMGWV